MPIKDASGDVIGVAQVINKLNFERFTENDEKVCKFEPISRIQISSTFQLILDFFCVFRYFHRIYNFAVLALEMHSFMKNLY